MTLIKAWGGAFEVLFTDVHDVGGDLITKLEALT